MTKQLYLLMVICLSAVSIDVAHAYSLCEENRSYSIPAYAKYTELLCRGENDLKNKNWKSAISNFEKALSYELHEIPNYEAIVKLGFSYCMQGEFDEGNALLDKFTCMLAIDAGDIDCTDLGEQCKNKNYIYEECYNKMCGEAYISYYGVEEAAAVNRMKMLRVELENARKSCLKRN